MRNDDTNKNLWNHSAALAPETSALSSDISCDTAIIGGGFTGLSAALHLAEAGIDAVVLEAKAIGFGGSGRNVGLVNAGMWMRPDDIIAAVGETVGERLVKDLGDGPAYVFELIGKHGIECEAIHNGTLHLAVGQDGVKEVETRAAQWQRRGAPVEALSADMAGKLTGASGFAGALLDRRAGTVQPLGYARGLARAAMNAGARLFTGTPVVSATRNGETIVLKTAGGQVRAKKLIIASNAYSGVVPSMNWSDHGQELVPMYYFQFATNPLPPRDHQPDNAARPWLLGHRPRHDLLPHRQGGTADLRIDRIAGCARQGDAQVIRPACGKRALSLHRRFRVRILVGRPDRHDAQQPALLPSA